MAAALRDIRYTVRRSGGEDPLLYPRILRDRAMLPQIGMAIEYFEGHVGKERRELDAALLVDFFGDQKLARTMVTALSRTYRFRPRRFDDVAGKVAVRRLTRAGIVAPRDFRLVLFDGVNAHRSGFAVGASREDAYAELGERFGLRADAVAQMLYLDQDEHAVLRRLGERARPEDVAAQFNYVVLEILLRQAEQVTFHIADRAGDALTVLAAVGAAHGVDLLTDRGDGTVRLQGRQDALGVWSRHGRKLARVALEILERACPSILDGEATLALPAGRFRLRLTPELLAMLSAPGAAASDWIDDLAERGAALDQVTAAVRKAQEEAPRRWSMRRFPEAGAWQAGAVLPDLLLNGPVGAVLVCAVRSARHAQRLAGPVTEATSGEPLLFVGAAEALGPLREVGARCVAPEAFTLAAVEGLWQDKAVERRGSTKRAARVAGG